MATLIAWGNSRQSGDVPPMDKGNPRLWQRHAARQLGRRILGELLKTAGKPTALLADIVRTASGRPQFCADLGVDFNLSHSGDWVGVVLKTAENGDKAVVGIDIETPKVRRFAALLNHFAPEREQAWFARQPHSEAAFYRCWCLREAVLKSQGVGIVKLSEVRHLPEQQRIFSVHCPPGELLFSTALPFYLAVFHNQPESQLKNQSENRPHFFRWNGETLVKTALPAAVSYRVNAD